MQNKINPVSRAPHSPMKAKDFQITYKRDLTMSNVYSNKHSHYEFYFLISGRVSYTIENTLYHLIPGDVLLISPNQIHFANIETDGTAYERYVLWLTEDYVKSLSSQKSNLSHAFSKMGILSSYLHISTDMQATFTSLLQKILIQSNSNEYGSDLLLNYYITELLIHIVRIKLYQNNLHSGNEFNGNELIFKALNFISENIIQDITVNEIASALFVSRSHLSNNFTDFMGMSIHQYIIKKKLYLARQDLLSNMPIENICTAYNFGNYSSFYRAFKKEFNMSPREYYKGAK